MLPRVILHNAVSLDGRIDGFPMDLQQYYELISIWKEDATLAGSHTFLQAASVAPPEDESALSRLKWIRATRGRFWSSLTAAGAYAPGII